MCDGTAVVFLGEFSSSSRENLESLEFDTGHRYPGSVKPGTTLVQKSTGTTNTGTTRVGYTAVLLFSMIFYIF